ncbi:hypothetical protein B4083_0732 [Bacillus cereus]|nr:hypothetical protein B4083_0732 [Bacillus cereus]
MIETTIKYLTNPVTSTLLFELEEKGEATAKQMASKYPEIPHATLYRSLNRMCKDGIIQVVRENAVRGTYEKVYSLCSGFSNSINDVLFDKNGKRVENFNQEYLKYFVQFAKSLIKEFKDFANDNDSENLDCGGFMVHSLYATKEEMRILNQQMVNSVVKMQENNPGENRTLRNIAVIIPPSKGK